MQYDPNERDVPFLSAVISDLQVKKADGTFVSLNDGDTVDFVGSSGSKTLTIRGKGNPIPLATRVETMAWQVDGGFFTAYSPNTGSTYDPFEFSFSETECTPTSAWYMLTLHAWDNTGDHTQRSTTFFRNS